MISKKILNNIKNGSIIRQMFEDGNRLKKIYGKENVYDFSLGNPATDVPDKITQSLIKFSSEADHSYMDNAGYHEVREKVAKFLKYKYSMNVGADNVVMTVGAAGGLNVILKTILDPNDEVIVFRPYFGEYKFYIDNFNGKIVECETDDKFLPDLNKLKELINYKTKAVIINTPNNPTGTVYPKKLIEELVNLLKSSKNDIYLISDEPYREIYYGEDEYLPITNIYKNAFICYSYSKSLSIPGERIGYVVVSSEIDDFKTVTAGLKTSNRILGFVNAPAIFQKVIAENIESVCDLDLYVKNRELLMNILDDIGYTYIKPEGAFYLFLKTLDDNDLEFCNVAKSFNLLLVPSAAFGINGYARISYCVDTDIVKNSKKAFIQLWDYYKNGGKNAY